MENEPEHTMKIYLERKDGQLYVKQKTRQKKLEGARLHPPMRTMKVVKDTPENLDDIKRWAEAVGHTVEG